MPDVQMLRALHRKMIGITDENEINYNLKEFITILSNQFDDKNLTQENCRELIEVVKPFIVHMHLKHNTMEVLDQTRYYDYMAGLVSCYIDLQMKLLKMSNLIKMINKLKSDIISSISALLSTIFGNSKLHILDTLLQLQSKPATKRRCLSRFLMRISSDKHYTSTPEKYMKMIIIFKIIMTKCPKKRKKQLKTRSSKLKVPSGLIEWLKQFHQKELVKLLKSHSSKSINKILLSDKFNFKQRTKFLDRMCKYRVEIEENRNENRDIDMPKFFIDKGDEKESETNHPLLFFVDKGRGGRKDEEESMVEDDSYEGLTKVIDNMEDTEDDEEESDDECKMNEEKGGKSDDESDNVCEMEENVEKSEIDDEKESENEEKSEIDEDQREIRLKIVKNRSKLVTEQEIVDILSNEHETTLEIESSDLMSEIEQSAIITPQKSKRKLIKKDLDRLKSDLIDRKTLKSSPLKNELKKNEIINSSSTAKIAEKSIAAQKNLTTPRKNAEKSTTPRKNAEKSTTPRKNAEKSTTPRKNAEKSTTPRKNAEKSTTPRKNPEISTTPRKNAKKSILFEKKEDKSILYEKNLETCDNDASFHKPLSASTPFCDNFKLNISHDSLASLSTSSPRVELIDIRKQLEDESLSELQLYLTDSDESISRNRKKDTCPSSPSKNSPVKQSFTQIPQKSNRSSPSKKSPIKERIDLKSNRSSPSKNSPVKQSFTRLRSAPSKKSAIIRQEVDFFNKSDVIASGSSLSKRTRRASATSSKDLSISNDGLPRIKKRRIGNNISVIASPVIDTPDQPVTEIDDEINQIDLISSSKRCHRRSSRIARINMDSSVCSDDSVLTLDGVKRKSSRYSTMERKVYDLRDRSQKPKV